MNQALIIDELSRNACGFSALLKGTPDNQARWKPSSNQWCLLEVVCHLYDEEREDFRARVKHCLKNPESPMSPIDPVSWVKDRKYLEQDFGKKSNSFLKERDLSIKWLESLESPDWENFHDHPTLGKMSAGKFLSNWLAHDYIHLRQINRIRYQYLNEFTEDSLKYAGDW